MNFLRDGKEMDEQTYIKSSDSMQKMQQIVDKLVSTTPNLGKFITQDSIIKPQKAFAQDIIKKQDDPKRKNIKLQAQKNEMSYLDWEQRCKELEILLSYEKDQTQVLEQEMETRQERFVKKEIEFRKQIEQLQSELKLKSNLTEEDQKKPQLEEIKQYSMELLDKISIYHQNTSKVMFKQEKDIMKFFMDKINDVKKEFENERAEKTKKDQRYLEKENQLSAQLEWIKDIAQKINNENLNLQKKYSELKQQYQTQESDREVLLKDLIIIKKKNAQIKSKIKENQKVIQQNDEQLNQLNEESQISEKKQMVPSLYRRPVTANNENEHTQYYQQQIQSLQNQIQKDQNDLRYYKNLYVTDLQQRQELEKILQDIITDIKTEMIKIKGDQRIFKNDTDNQKENRFKIMDKLINNEKVLLLIYDKIFHQNFKIYNNIPQDDYDL